MDQRKKMDSAVQKSSLSWDDLLTLSTLARNGSYSATARALGLTRVTVARRMRRLEEALGYPLVEERQGAVNLTEAARQVVATAHEMNELVASLGQRAPAGGLAGLVRVTAPEGISAFVLAPALAQLQREHPGLRIELQATSAVLSISHKEADLAVRLARPEDGNLVAVALAPLRYAMYAASGVAEPAQLPLTAYDRAAGLLPESLYLRTHYPDQEPALRSNSLAAQYESVRSGGARGLLPDYLARLHGGLLALPGTPPLEKPVYLVFHGAQRENALIQLVRRRIETALEAALGGA
ncbi:LysR substrate-binding domain-containing protein [Massilia sp. IC2-476]|uniref:LysR family transcriptional regulator n=1 Tax=Massilia sp. IC2-476 TaxID=2887199 RepID=UPI001D0FB5B1|nr:LysR family transcriptional regulator [Massilia sp. IC2-476]